MTRKNFLADVGIDIPAALTQDHDHVREELSRLADVPGRVGQAAKALARVCLPHFDLEEKFVFPAFIVLHHLALGGDARPEMVGVLPVIEHFCEGRGLLRKQHQSVRTALAALREAAAGDGSGRVRDLARMLANHEEFEDKVIWPTGLLISRHSRRKLMAFAAQASALPTSA